jgi:hypothetical protein
MNYDLLFTPNDLAINLAAIDESSLEDLIMGWQVQYPECAIYRLRGHKAINDTCFFDEAAAVLQFPYYFGENWDAFEECINDLSWIPQTSFLLIFSHADQLLNESEKGFSILMQIIDAANKSWQSNGNIGDEVAKIPFHALLACSNDRFPGLCDRVKATGVPFSNL